MWFLKSNPFSIKQKAEAALPPRRPWTRLTAKACGTRQVMGEPVAGLGRDRTES